jgi:hypothetical protein
MSGILSQPERSTCEAANHAFTSKSGIFLLGRTEDRTA